MAHFEMNYRIDAAQGNNDARLLEFRLLANSVPWLIPEGQIC